jgi:hypothetical protein
MIVISDTSAICYLLLLNVIKVLSITPITFGSEPKIMLKFPGFLIITPILY